MENLLAFRSCKFCNRQHNLVIEPGFFVRGRRYFYQCPITHDYIAFTVAEAAEEWTDETPEPVVCHRLSNED